MKIVGGKSANRALEHLPIGIFEMPGEDAAHVVGEEIAIPAFDAKPEALVSYAVSWARVTEMAR